MICSDICHRCGGTGLVSTNATSFDWGDQSCPACDGTGRGC